MVERTVGAQGGLVAETGPERREANASANSVATTRPKRSGTPLRVDLWLPPLTAFGILCVLWQLVAVHNRHLIPTVPQVAGELWRHPGLYWHDLLVTLQEAIVGAACGMLAALVLAVGMSELRMVERALMPLAVVLNVTPIVAIAPGLVVAFGFGLAPRYIVTAAVVFFPFLVNVLAGLRSADPLAQEVFVSLHASRVEILWKLKLPNSLPYLFAAARICLPLSLIGAVVAEFEAAGNNGGLGALAQTASNLSDLKAVYASVVVLALLGIVLTALVILLQRRLLSWHHSTSWSGR
jgi:NitT/TauT family transport system permease protein